MSQTVSFHLPEHLAARRSAQRRESLVQWVCAVIIVGCVATAGLLLTPINRIRQERQLVVDPREVGTLPPDIALLGKLGTFRALAIDWAAIRAERLKQEGKVYEALQLHSTVCALAPGFPDVWIYSAWNMAYNISVMQYSPEQRWQWVRNGIEILRDKGIKYNPRAVKLYKELSWIYWHKIGDFLDDEHWNYKRALAIEMEKVLGAHPTAFEPEEYLAWFKKIVNAPRDLGSVLDEEPIARFVEELRRVDLAPDETLLDFVARNIRPEVQLEQQIIDDPDYEDLKSKRLRLLTGVEHQEARERLIAALRSQLLRERHKFDLDWMLHLMQDRYGPLDWRNAFSHSLYWSSLGDKLAEGRINNSPNDAINNARFVLFSLKNLIARGRVVLAPNFDKPFNSVMELMPDTRYIPYLYDQYMAYGEELFGDDPEYRQNTPGPIFMTGFVTDMHSWIELLYLEGGERNIEQAKVYYDWLRQYNPHPDGRTQEQYLVSLEEFVMGELKSHMNTYRGASAVVGSFTLQALKQFALGDIEPGLNSLKHAHTCYQFWQSGLAGPERTDRRSIPSPRATLRGQLRTFMEDPQYDPVAKARLWRNLPLEDRQMVYDELLSTFEKICADRKPPWSRERAFPEPAGMEEARKRPRSKEDEPDRPEEGTRHRE
jgi:hypothetical protein